MNVVFFSFEYEDVSNAMIVRNSWVFRGEKAAGFRDKAAIEKVRKESDPAIRKWINEQLHGTSVTIVLIGKGTHKSRWVKYEIERSEEKGNGLMGIDISGLNAFGKKENYLVREMLEGYPVYQWGDNSYDDIGKWVEQAANRAGR